MNLAVVVPTCRPGRMKAFIKAWRKELAGVPLVVVNDGDGPYVHHYRWDDHSKWAFGKALSTWNDKCVHDLIFNHNDGVRNLGFLYVARYLPETTHILTLDDDTLPTPGCVQGHLDVIGRRVPVSWISTAQDYMRGFPYGIRDEAKVWASHGVWDGVADWDAATQLVKGNRVASFYRGPIPKGVFAPICGMNFCFAMEALPWVYFAPMGPRAGVDRFADIWMGICLKRESDRQGKAIVTGHSMVRHERASDVFQNLKKEATGLEMNETFWKKEPNTPYFKRYKELRKRWQELIFGMR